MFRDLISWFALMGSIGFGTLGGFHSWSGVAITALVLLGVVSLVELLYRNWWKPKHQRTTNTR